MHALHTGQPACVGRYTAIVWQPQGISRFTFIFVSERHGLSQRKFKNQLVWDNDPVIKCCVIGLKGAGYYTWR